MPDRQQQIDRYGPEIAVDPGAPCPRCAHPETRPGTHSAAECIRNLRWAIAGGQQEVAALRAEVEGGKKFIEDAAAMRVEAERQRDAMRAERDRLLDCYERLSTELLDLGRDYTGRTCPRVQCINALKKAEAERDAYERQLEAADLIAAERLAECDAMRAVVDAAVRYDEADDARDGTTAGDLHASMRLAELGEQIIEFRAAQREATDES